MPNLPPMIQRIVADPGAYVAGFGVAEAANTSFAGSATRLSATMLKIGAVITAVATGIAVAFDREITKVITLVGVAEDQVDSWKESILEIAPAVGRGPNELAKALFVVTSAGERGANTLSILEGSAKAAAVGLGDTAVVARTVTAAMQAYSRSNLTAEEALDILLTTVREGNLEADSLAGSLGRVIGIASQLGVSFDQVGGFIATFTRLGVNAEIAATSLRATLTAMLKPTEQQIEAFAALGKTAASFREEIRDKGLTRALIDLIQATGGNVETIGALIPNVRALSGVLGTAGAQAESFVTITENITNSQGNLERAFLRARETTAQNFAELKAEVTVLLLQFGTDLLPLTEDVIDSLGRLATGIGTTAEAFGKLPKPVREAVISIGLLVTIGPIAVATLGRMVVGVQAFGTAVALSNIPTLALAIAISGWGTAIAGGIIGLGALTGLLVSSTRAADAAAKAYRGLGTAIDVAAPTNRTAEATRTTINSLAQLRAATQDAIEETRAELQALEEEGLTVPFGVDERALEQLTKAAKIELTTKLAELEQAALTADVKVRALAKSLDQFDDTKIDIVTGDPELENANQEAIDKLILSLREKVVELAAGKAALDAYRLANLGAFESEKEIIKGLKNAATQLEFTSRARQVAGEMRLAVFDAEIQRLREFENEVGVTTDRANAQLFAQAQAAEDAAQRMAQAFGDAAVDIAFEFEGILDSARDLVIALLEEFARLAAREAIVGPVTDLFRRFLINVPDAPPRISGVDPPSLDPEFRFPSVQRQADLAIAPSSQVVGGSRIEQNIEFNIGFVDGASGEAWLERNGKQVILRTLREANEEDGQFRRGARAGF